MKYQNYSTYVRPPGEVIESPGLTVPGQALAVRDILERYVRGRDVETFAGVYTDSDLVPDGWERMDEIERIEYTRAMKADLETKVKRVRDSKPTVPPGPSDPASTRVEPSE